MTPACRKIIAICSVLVAVDTASATEDLLLRTKVGVVDVELFVPKEARPVRGLLVHVFHYEMRTEDRWAILCRELGWAHINTIISRRATNRPKQIREAISVALRQFAKKAKLPELVHVPRAGTGFSAGGMVTKVLQTEPEKMLTNAISCSWVRDPESMGKAVEVPALFLIGARPDGFRMLPAIRKYYEPAIEQKRPWALGLQHECKHDWANSGTLMVPWIRAIAKLRYPHEYDPTKPFALKPVTFDQGWWGDRRTIQGTFAEVAPADKFEGDAKHTVWLPDRATAYVWRAWQTKNSPLDLQAHTKDGATRLPPFRPRKSFGMTIAENESLVLGVKGTVRALRRVRFYHGDTLLGTSQASPWQIEWKPKNVGCYAVWAEYQVETRQTKKIAVTNPALICVKPATENPNQP